MPNPSVDQSITALVETFTRQIVTSVEEAAAERIQAALAGAFGIQQKRGPGRPPKQAVAQVAPVASAPARKKQLCPVPGCKNLAAPVFGMVCKEHKNLAKAKIKKYQGGAAESQGCPGDRHKCGDANEGEEDHAEGGTGAETSRPVSGCLEVAHRRGQGKGEEDRSGEERGRGREARAVDQEGKAVGPHRSVPRAVTPSTDGMPYVRLWATHMSTALTANVGARRLPRVRHYPL